MTLYTFSASLKKKKKKKKSMLKIYKFIILTISIKI